MATLILRPNGDSSIQLTRSTGSYNYECVDEVTSDGDSSFVSTTSTSTRADLYTFPNHSTESGTINKVTIYFQAKGQTVSQGKGGTNLTTHSQNYKPSERNLATSYTDYYTEYTTNPYTNSAWTWTEIDDILAGVFLRSTSVSYQARCTQVWIEVDYTSSIDVSVSDGISGSDSQSVDMTASLSCIDGFKQSDGYVQQGTMYSSISDLFKVSDTITKLATMNMALSDSLYNSDTASAITFVQYLLDLSESVIVSDSSVSQMHTNSNLLDGFKVSDDAVKVADIYKTIMDGFIQSDITEADVKTSIITCTIAAGAVSENLTNFPYCMTIDATSGLNNRDLTNIFDVLGSNYKKIRVMQGETQRYVEVATWDVANKKAELYINIDIPTVGTTFTLEYNQFWNDNTDYVGWTGTTPAQTVWDSNYVSVYHMNDKTGDSTKILDSTSHAYDGTKGATRPTNAANIVNGTGTLATNPTTVSAGTGETTVAVTAAGTFTITIPTNQMLIVSIPSTGGVTSVSMPIRSAGSRTITVTGTGNFLARWSTTAAPTEVTGLAGKAQQFSTADATYAVTPAYSFGAGGTLTFQFMFKYTQNYGYMVFLGDGTESGTSGYVFIKVGYPYLRFEYANGTSIVDVNVSNISAYYNIYALYTIVADYAAGTVDLYIDGSHVTQKTMTNPLYPSTSRAKYIGSYMSDYWNAFNGYIDHIDISNTGRSAGWIAATNKSLRDTLGSYTATFYYYYRSMQESIIMSDSLIKNMYSYLVFLDGIGFGDYVTKFLETMRSLSDGFTISDTNIKYMAAYKTLLDSIGISDTEVLFLIGIYISLLHYSRSQYKLSLYTRPMYNIGIYTS